MLCPLLFIRSLLKGGRLICEKLKDLIPDTVLDPLQAAIGGKIVAENN